MKLEKTEEVKTITASIIGYKCDVCGKEVDTSNLKGWHHFEVDYYDCYTERKYDVCCVECYIKLIEKLLREFQHEEDLVIDGLNGRFAYALMQAFYKKFPFSAVENVIMILDDLVKNRDYEVKD